MISGTDRIRKYTGLLLADNQSRDLDNECRSVSGNDQNARERDVIYCFLDSPTQADHWTRYTHVREIVREGSLDECSVCVSRSE